jgi:hypothetical protein
MTDLRNAAKQALEEWRTEPGSVRMASLMMALERALAEDAIDILVEREELRAVVVEKLSAVVTSFLKDRKKATCPNCASLMEQNTELDKKLAEWVGLTEEELYEIFDAADDGQSPCGVCGACGKCSREVAIAEAVEAKLKEKNT